MAYQQHGNMFVGYMAVNPVIQYFPSGTYVQQQQVVVHADPHISGEEHPVLYNSHFLPPNLDVEHEFPSLYNMNFMSVQRNIASSCYSYMHRNLEDVEGERTMYDFMNDCSLVRIDSPLRASFVRYLQRDVPNAAYLEGLRVAILENELHKAISIMEPMKTRSPHAGFAIPILKICVGEFYLAVNEMYHFWERTKKDYANADHLGAALVRHIAQLGPSASGSLKNRGPTSTPHRALKPGIGANDVYSMHTPKWFLVWCSADVEWCPSFFSNNSTR